MFYLCKVCKKVISGRHNIRKHIREEHKKVFRTLADEKRNQKRSTGRAWRKVAPLSEKYEVIKEEST